MTKILKMPRTPRTAKTPKPGTKTKISPKGQKSITDFTVSKAVEKVHGKFMVFDTLKCHVETHFFINKIRHSACERDFYEK